MGDVPSIEVGSKVQVMGVGEILIVRQIRLAKDRSQISAAWCEGADSARWIALSALVLVDGEEA